MSFEVLDNPFDPNQQDYMPEEIPFDEIIRRAITNALLERTNVWRPAKVVAVNGNQSVDIQVLLKVKYVTTPAPTLLPPIRNVMVVAPAGAGYSMKLPIAVGDTGVALFCDRSLDIWANGDGSALDPGDCRTHNLQDAVFIPGLLPFAKQTVDKTNDLVVTCGKAQLRINPAGGFALKNETQELLANLVTLVQTLATASTVLGGPFVPSVVTELNQIITNLQSLEGN